MKDYEIDAARLDRLELVAEIYDASVRGGYAQARDLPHLLGAIAKGSTVQIAAGTPFRRFLRILFGAKLRPYTGTL